MHLFFEIVKRSIQRQIHYRSAIFAGLVTNLFFGMLRAAVLVALYNGRSQVADISMQGAVTYTGLSQATIGVLSLFSWFLLMNSVYTGEVATDLLKPKSYYTFWLAQDAGRAVVELLLRSLPLMAVYALIYRITLPQSLLQGSGVIMALILAWLLSFSWRFLLNLASFWTPNAIGIARFGFIIAWFLSGFLMPLRYFPDWFVQLCNLTPFPSMINSIVEIYLGVAQGHQMLERLAVQIFWILALFGLGQLVLRLGIRRLVIQGG